MAPGSYFASLGTAIDRSRRRAWAMVGLRPLRRTGPTSPSSKPTWGGCRLLPDALGGAWARASYLHLSRPELPLALAQLHRALALGAPLEMTLRAGRPFEGQLPRPTTSLDGSSPIGEPRTWLPSWSGPVSGSMRPITKRAVTRRAVTGRARAVNGSRYAPTSRPPCPTTSAPACGCWCAASTRAWSPPTPGSGTRGRPTGSGGPQWHRGWCRPSGPAAPSRSWLATESE